MTRPTLPHMTGRPRHSEYRLFMPRWIVTNGFTAHAVPCIVQEGPITWPPLSFSCSRTYQLPAKWPKFPFFVFPLSHIPRLPSSAKKQKIKKQKKKHKKGLGSGSQAKGQYPVKNCEFPTHDHPYWHLSRHTKAWAYLPVLWRFFDLATLQ